MTWNHRVVKSEPDEKGYVYYSIREVFYKDDGSIFGWTTDPIDPFGETPEQLKADIDRMSKAFDLPVLDESELAARLKTNQTKEQE